MLQFDTCMPENSFEDVYGDLRSILTAHTDILEMTKNSEIGVIAETKRKDEKGKGEFFGAAEIKKNYVSFYLMPIYCFPELAANISPELKKRMQGKSCFNFKKREPALFDELADHVKTGIEKYRSEGKL